MNGKQMIMGTNPHVWSIWDRAMLVAATDCCILISGQSGTGKGLLAQEVHKNSRRAERPFVKVNCAAIPDELIESELFGHERGAFTGAVKRRVGRFELADGGTLFLDEVGEMSPALQVKLLRVLQDGEFERVGGEVTLRADVRVIAATNCNLRQQVAEGKFREDLYYRINVIPLHLPLLVERREDIPELVEHFRVLANEKHKREVIGIDPEVLRRFEAYSWPGNIRQLGNFIERMVLLTKSKLITFAEVEAEEEFRPEPKAKALVAGKSPGSLLAKTLKEAERQAILEALQKAGGNKIRAAEILGITRQTLYKRLERLP